MKLQQTMTDNTQEDQQRMEEGQEPNIPSNDNSSCEKQGFCTKPKLAIVALLLLAALATVLGVTLSNNSSSSSSSSSSSENASSESAVTMTNPPVDTGATGTDTTSPSVSLDAETQAKLQTFQESLPEATQVSLRDPTSHQSRALSWLSTHQNLATMEDWRMQQLLALTTFFYAFNGPEWKQFIKQNWLLDSKSECDWIVGDYDYLALGGSGSQINEAEVFNVDVVDPTCNGE